MATRGPWPAAVTAGAVVSVSGRIAWYYDLNPATVTCCTSSCPRVHGIVGRLAAGLTGAVYGDTVSMVAMLMVVMGAENVVVPASAPWRPTTTPLS